MNNEVLIGAVGLFTTICGWYFGYSNFLRNKKQEGTKDGALLSDIGYIKSGIDDLKRKQEKAEERHIETISRLSLVESSAAQAHKRIDELKSKVEYIHKDI